MLHYSHWWFSDGVVTYHMKAQAENSWNLLGPILVSSHCEIATRATLCQRTDVFDTFVPSIYWNILRARVFRLAVLWISSCQPGQRIDDTPTWPAACLTYRAPCPSKASPILFRYQKSRYQIFIFRTDLESSPYCFDAVYTCQSLVRWVWLSAWRSIPVRNWFTFPAGKFPISRVIPDINGFCMFLSHVIPSGKHTKKTFKQINYGKSSHFFLWINHFNYFYGHFQVPKLLAHMLHVWTHLPKKSPKCR